jgi:tetratricopeptide (TPR) repeat protein
LERFDDLPVSRDVLERSALSEDLRIASEPLQLRQELKRARLEIEPSREPVELYRGPLDDQAATDVSEFELGQAVKERDQFARITRQETVEAQAPEWQDNLLLSVEAGDESSSDLPGPEEVLDRLGERQVAQEQDKAYGITSFEGSSALMDKAVEGLSWLRSPVELGSLRDSYGGSYVPSDDGQMVSSVDSLRDERIDYRERAQVIMGSHKSFASFSRARFEENVKAGEGYLKAGKYYRAVDAYSLALVYEPGSASAVAGRSHALLGAGEYMSSALFLSRALEALAEDQARTSEEGEVSGAGATDAFSPLTASFKLIDRDTLEDRIVEIGQWQQKSDSVELRFLLSYIYYQMGRLDLAKEALPVAEEKMFGTSALVVLKQAIDSGQ